MNQPLQNKASWYLTAVAGGIAVLFGEPFLFKFGPSMYYAGAALICLGLGGIIGGIQTKGSFVESEDYEPSASEKAKNIAANALMVIGGILFILSLFS